MTPRSLRAHVRKLHAAWRELSGKPIHVLPTVAVELAPVVADDRPNRAVDSALTILDDPAAILGRTRRRQLLIQSWWARMWVDPESPYRRVRMSDASELKVERLLDAIDPRCFPGVPRNEIRDHNDARIVCETIAVGAQMLLTSNRRTIARNAVNDWVRRNAEAMDVPARAVLFHADAAIAHWLRTERGRERWLDAVLIAAWPAASDQAAATEVVGCVDELLGALSDPDGGGKLVESASIRRDALLRDRRLNERIERIRLAMPFKTVATDRAHPSHPRR